MKSTGSQYALPRNSFFGSGSVAPSRKNRLIQRGYNATEKIASEGRSAGPKPITSADYNGPRGRAEVVHFVGGG